MDALLWELLEKGNPDDWVEILIKSDDWEKLASENMYSTASIGNIRSCRIRRGDIVEVRNIDGVISMKADRHLFLEPSLDEQQQSIHSENQFKGILPRRPAIVQTGKGVVMGIADWGFDFSHCNFIDKDGNTRFLAIWDQGAPYDGTNIYGFGTVYFRQEINDALSTDAPFEALGYHPGRNDLYQQGMHGTHVLDIAAGNGSIGDSGVAPEADLIAVHLATGVPRDLLGLGTSVRVFDAIHFINAMAEDRPLVINMSVGSHTEAHVGKSLIEQAIDHLVTASPGKCVVQSSGNYFSSRVHTEGQIQKGNKMFLEWLVSNEDLTSNSIEIWYHAEDEILISLQQGDAEYRLKDMGIGMSKVNNRQQQEIGRYYHRSHEPNTGLNHIVIILEANAGFGKWKVWLNPVNIENGRFHSWIERDHGNVSNQSRFSLQQSVTSCTTGSICNGFHNICVGAINAQDNRNNIAFFSSSGPTADNRQKPDLVAPGVGILAAKSASMDQRRSECELTHKTGTSMAAPVVAGAIALLYEAFGKEPTIAEIRSKLKAACTLPVTDDPLEKQRYGYGILDIKKLLTVSRSPRAVIQRPTAKINTMNNNNIMYNGYDTPESIESLVADAENRFPRLRDGDLCKFFDSLPVQKILLDVISRGDLLLRRQYGHHRRARWWIIDRVDDNELP